MFSPEELLQLSSPNAELLSITRSNGPGSDAKPLHSLADIHTARAFLTLFNSILRASKAFVPAPYNVSDIQITARDGTVLPGRVYAPLKGARQAGGSPGLYCVHGGGYVLGDLDGQEWVAEIWCGRLGGVMVDVLYRHAPERQWPGSVEDAWDGFGWMMKSLNVLGINPVKGLVVGGDSNGGDMAMMIAHLHAQEHPLDPPITGLYMGCPIVMEKSTVPEKYKEYYLSMEHNKKAKALTAESVELVLSLLNPDLTSPLAMPILFPDHSRLPRSYIQVAGMDPLRDGGLILEQVLKDSGVPTKLQVYPGLPHCFWGPFMHAEFTKQHKKDVEEGMKWLLGLS